MPPPAPETLHIAERPLPGTRVVQGQIEGPGGPLTRRAALAALRASRPLRDQLTEALASSPFDAFFWELPPQRRGLGSRPFEWVTSPSPELAGVAPDPTAFIEHLGGGGDRIARFRNLGGDAVLLAPCRLDAPSAHLADFVRGAPPALVDAFWVAIIEALEERLIRSPEPFWVSTSGLGVPWLHARIDGRPKYIMHAPYRA